jgi:hypothetical protein
MDIVEYKELIVSTLKRRGTGIEQLTTPVDVEQSEQYCECSPPNPDTDNECCRKCTKLLDLED